MGPAAIDVCRLIGKFGCHLREIARGATWPKYPPVRGELLPAAPRPRAEVCLDPEMLGDFWIGRGAAKFANEAETGDPF